MTSVLDQLYEISFTPGQEESPSHRIIRLRESAFYQENKLFFEKLLHNDQQLYEELRKIFHRHMAMEQDERKEMFLLGFTQGAKLMIELLLAE